MSLLQVKINNTLQTAIKTKAAQYDVPVSSLVKIVLAKYFLRKEEDDISMGNVFNAGRDSKGKGIAVDDFIDQL